MEPVALYVKLGRERLLLSRIDDQWAAARIGGKRSTEFEPFEGLSPTSKSPILLFENEQEIQNFLSAQDEQLSLTQQYVSLVRQYEKQFFVQTVPEWIDMLESCSLTNGNPLLDVARAMMDDDLLRATVLVFGGHYDYDSANCLALFIKILGSAVWSLEQLLEHGYPRWYFAENLVIFRQQLHLVDKFRNGEGEYQILAFASRSYLGELTAPGVHLGYEKKSLIAAREPEGSLRLYRMKRNKLVRGASTFKRGTGEQLILELVVLPQLDAPGVRWNRSERELFARGIPLDLTVGVS